MRHNLPPKFELNDTLVLENPIVIEIRKSDGGSIFFENLKTMALWMGIGKVVRRKRSWWTGKYHYLIGSKAYGQLSCEWYREDQLTLATKSDIERFKSYFRDHYKIADFMNGWPIRLDWLES